MKIIRRELLYLSGIAASATLMSKIAGAPTQAGPGTAAPWHMHPGAQELLYVIEGNLTVEIEASGTTLLKTGEAGTIAADLVHLARNENTSESVKALVMHSRAAKDKPLIVVVKK
jgi:quercetin dioxygenase-like cupin family protein